MFLLQIKRVFKIQKFASKMGCIRFISKDVHFPNILDKQKKLMPNSVESFSPHIISQMQIEPHSKHLPIYFDAVREIIDLSQFPVEIHDLKQAKEHFVKCMDYNLSGGGEHFIRMSQVLCKHLMGEDQLSSETVRQVYFLGWAIEMMAMSLLMTDDMLDNAHLRRNKICWYRLKDAQSLAVNDIMMVQNACYLVLKRFFGHLPCYLSMIQAINETSMITMMGQSNDVLIRNSGVSHFKLDKLKCVIIAKVFYYSHTPVVLPMLFAGFNLDAQKQLFDDVKSIMNDIAYLFQIQNDFMDMYADSNVTKKSMNDIENGAFCWMSTMAMELGTEQQKDVMKNFYGKDDPPSIDRIKQLYADLNLPDVFKMHYKRAYDDIKQQIGVRLQSNEPLQRALLEISSWYFDPK